MQLYDGNGFGTQDLIQILNLLQLFFEKNPFIGGIEQLLYAHTFIFQNVPFHIIGKFFSDGDLVDAPGLHMPAPVQASLSSLKSLG